MGGQGSIPYQRALLLPIIMTSDCEYFTVIKESKDYVSLHINQKGSFKGNQFPMPAGHAAEFFQFLMDEMSLAVVASAGSSLVCRKVISDKQLIDILHRSGAL